MKSVSEHYADHLAPVYVWMAGGTGAALAAGESELEELHLPVQAGDAALDLGLVLACMLSRLHATMRASQRSTHRLRFSMFSINLPGTCPFATSIQT